MADAAPRAPIVAVTALRGAGGALPLAAAVGVAASHRADTPAGVVLCDVGAAGARRPTLLASPAARALESRLRADLSAAARGALCWVTAPWEDWPDTLARSLAAGASLVVAALEPGPWREVVGGPGVSAAVVRADLPAHRGLAGLVAIELRQLGVPAAVVTATPGLVAGRRALSGLDPGGELGARARRIARRLPRAARGEAGQALPLVLALAFLAIVAGLTLALLGAAATGGSRLQRAADLAAVSAARSMRDDFPRLFGPRRPAGAPSPAPLTSSAYRRRARLAAARAVRANGIPASSLRVSFPRAQPAPTRVRVAVTARVALAGGTTGGVVRASAVAAAEPSAASGDGPPRSAEGGGYSGPLAYRQGEGMRPDVAAAFDRLEAAARRAGLALVVTSAFRSDAEQAALFAANPDPRWVAPPGSSLHRCATELDLGPPGAYAWLDTNAPRFGFLRRYEWEAWHFGFVRGPAPCSPAGNLVGASGGDGRAASMTLPSFVPARFREPIARAASRWNVPAAVLAAQLMAESGFNPSAVSPAGADGIAQFMPATAAAYGLRDPFDADAAIEAQAHLMSDLLRQFGSIALALAAYNAGPAPVAACDCVPAYPETQAYVARILGLLAGSGALAPPVLEVRLVS